MNTKNADINNLFFFLCTEIGSRFTVLRTVKKWRFVIFNSPRGIDQIILSDYPGYPFLRLRNDLAQVHTFSDAVDETALRANRLELTFYYKEDFISVINQFLDDVYGEKKGSGYLWTAEAQRRYEESKKIDQSTPAIANA